MDIYFKEIIISSMFTITKEEKLFDIFIEKHKDVKPNESLYIYDRRYILQKAKEYGFNLLLMDRNKKYTESEFRIINNMNDVLDMLNEN